MMDQEDERRGVFEGLHVGVGAKISLLEQCLNALDRFIVVTRGPKTLGPGARDFATMSPTSTSARPSSRSPGASTSPRCPGGSVTKIV